MQLIKLRLLILTRYPYRVALITALIASPLLLPLSRYPYYCPYYVASAAAYLTALIV